MKTLIFFALIAIFFISGCSGSVNIGFDGKDIKGSYEGKTKTEGETTSNPNSPGNTGSNSLSTSEVFPVIIFHYGNYSGNHQQLKSGYYDVIFEWEHPNRITIDNDQISSIKVHPGYKVICYEDSDRSGERITIFSDTDFDEPWKSMISAVEVIKLDD